MTAQDLLRRWLEVAGDCDDYQLVMETVQFLKLIPAPQLQSAYDDVIFGRHQPLDPSTNMPASMARATTTYCHPTEDLRTYSGTVWCLKCVGPATERQ